MLALPFTLEQLPVLSAADAVREIAGERPGTFPVLLGDADVFSVEWAECVDEFEDPSAILAEAETIDVDTWFAARAPTLAEAEARMERSLKWFNGGWRVLILPFDAVLLPGRLVKWAVTRDRPRFLSRSPFDIGPLAEDAPDRALSTVDALKAQLSDLESSGDGTEEELREIREVIAAIEAEGTGHRIFPDPIDYVTPRHSETLAAGLIATDQPWKTAAWLQHGTYAISAPKPVLVAHCRWLWDTYGARIITASTDHLGFEVARPPETPEEAREILSRFFTLCADEVNAEHRGTDGSSLVGATRWWVWWD
ncbi:MAG: DUF4253 domain-containing protein [Silicimonas sp.]